MDAILVGLAKGALNLTGILVGLRPYTVSPVFPTGHLPAVLKIDPFSNRPIHRRNYQYALKIERAARFTSVGPECKAATPMRGPSFDCLGATSRVATLTPDRTPAAAHRQTKKCLASARIARAIREDEARAIALRHSA